jgi:hypothetical protein
VPGVPAALWADPLLWDGVIRLAMLFEVSLAEALAKVEAGAWVLPGGRRLGERLRPVAAE